MTAFLSGFFSPSGQTPAPALEATSMRIIFVEWRIKKGHEKEFLEYWSTRSTVSDRSGLIGEFLTRVEDREQYPWIIWDLDDRWTTFYNVGFWREGTDFQEQIGRYMGASQSPLAFEAEPRRRVFLAPKRWRMGRTGLPVSTDSLHGDILRHEYGYRCGLNYRPEWRSSVSIKRGL